MAEKKPQNDPSLLVDMSDQSNSDAETIDEERRVFSEEITEEKDQVQTDTSNAKGKSSSKAQAAEEHASQEPLSDEERKKQDYLHAQSVFIDEVHGHLTRYNKLIQFTYSSTKAAAIMLLAAIVALLIANVGPYEMFVDFLDTQLGIVFGEYTISMSLGMIINDILMAVFFLLVGLEIKYEMTAGELTNIRQALLPIIAAVGGVCAPIVIYLIFNASIPDSNHGWGVPTATDIAFALGIMALLGNRVPNGVRVFLTTLAVADDIIAIIVIAVFYGHAPSFFWLAMAALVVVVLVIMNKAHVYSLVPYLLVGVVLWFCVFMSGVHSTIAGVLLAFTIPSGSRVNMRNFLKWSGGAVQRAEETYEPEIPISAQEGYLATVSRISRIARQVVPPATRLEHHLYPWVYFAILPLFALTNADVSFVGGDIGAMIMSPVFFGIFFGLLLGKPIGIMLFSFIVVKTKLASLPDNVNWIHMLGAAILGGVGFTMAIFVANLAFPAHPEYIVNAKVAILSASLFASIIGFTFLFIQAKTAKKRGLQYLTTTAPVAQRQTAMTEVAQQSAEILEELESPLLAQEIEAAQRDSLGHIAEIVVELGEDNERSDAKAVHTPETQEDVKE